MFRISGILMGCISLIVWNSPILAQDPFADSEPIDLVRQIESSPALDQNPFADSEPIDLARRIEELEQEVKSLRSAMHQEPAVPKTEPAGEVVPPAPPSIEAVPPQPPSGIPLVPFPHPWGANTEPAEYPSVRLTGFFHTDAAWFHQDARNRETVGDIQDGWDFRRARLAATGNVSEDISYMMEFDFAQGQPWFVDVWMDFQNVANTMNVRIGRFRQPFGMSELTTIRGLPFLERPLQFGVAPFRQTGIMAYGNDDGDSSNLTWAASGYRFLSDSFGNVYGDDGGWGLATRVTVLPIYENGGEQLLHFGADYSFNDPGRDVVQYVSTPEIFLGQNPNLGPAGLDKLPIDLVPLFVNTGQLPTDQAHLFNLEAAAGYGDLYFQSEVRWAVVDRLNGQPTETFPGAYGHVRYILTGEDLPYERDSGLFGRIVPHDPVKFGGGGGMGAWELAARVSWLDLNGTNLPGPGRRLTDWTLGLNWYLNRYVKFQLNYINANLDDPQRGDSEADVYAIRGQLDF